MTHVTEGSRTYLPTTKTYGEVIRTSILGTSAVVVQLDDGSMQAFCGGDANEVVDKTTALNGNGETVELPTDVKEVGPAVLEAMGLDEATRAALFQKFMVLDEETRLEKASYWEENQNDAELMSVFLSDLMTLLDEDTLYIQTQSQKLLQHLDESVRETMLTKFMTETTEEDRKAYIIEYTSVRTDGRKTQDFVQNMYQLLLDDSTYINMEFTNALALKGLFGTDASTLVDNYLENATESEITEAATRWRTYKMYRSSKGKIYAYNQCKKHL